MAREGSSHQSSDNVSTQHKNRSEQSPAPKAPAKKASASTPQTSTQKHPDGTRPSHGRRSKSATIKTALTRVSSTLSSNKSSSTALSTAPSTAPSTSRSPPSDTEIDYHKIDERDCINCYVQDRRNSAEFQLTCSYNNSAKSKIGDAEKEIKDINKKITILTERREQLEIDLISDKARYQETDAQMESIKYHDIELKDGIKRYQMKWNVSEARMNILRQIAWKQYESDSKKEAKIRKLTTYQNRKAAYEEERLRATANKKGKGVARNAQDPSS